MKRYAIIVAGGKGTRMQSDVPKQFLKMDNKPIVVHTVEKFLKASCEIILVLPQAHLKDWEVIKKHYFSNKEMGLAIGGGKRTASVKAGLEKTPDAGLVAIHDAVRPFTEPDIIEESFLSAEKYGSGVAIVALKDSIREWKGKEGSEARERQDFVLVQTPQTFRIAEIKDAYKKASGDSYTDDATVYENAGYKVRLVKGSYANIKVTTPEDLKG